MYVCTPEEFILVDLDTLLHKVEVVGNGSHNILYKNATIEGKG